MTSLLSAFFGVTVVVMMASSCNQHQGYCLEKAGQLKPNGEFYGLSCEHPYHKISRDGDILYCKCIRPTVTAESVSD